jgi:CheY-like chemotaxis protein
MKTILVVDDLASVRFYHQNLLKQAGYATQSARDGLEALAVLEKQTVDLVLLDLLMPKMSGFDLLQRLRANARFATLPVLVVTSETQSEQARQLQGAPHLSVLNKPLLPETLLAEVRRYLG